MRKSSEGYGPCFCLKCGLFFDDKRLNIVDYENCTKHKGKEGYRLIDKIAERDEINEMVFPAHSVGRAIGVPS